MFICENLVKSFYRTEKKNRRVEFNAVDGISLQVNPGEIVGVLGPNGAGKTTLLRMLATLLKPTSGEVYMLHEKDDIKIDTPIDIKKNIGYLSGNTKLYGRLSVREMLRLFAGIYELSDEQVEERIAEVEKLLDLSEFIDNRIEKLSTGQTQRASIARCIVHNPDIYIFDEPTLGLDILSSAAIIEFMKKEKAHGKTVIYSTHYMEEAEYLCDRIVLIYKGKIVMKGSPDMIMKKTGTTSMRDAFYNIVEKEGMKYED
ncbi:MAG: ATP-binding cassette domain-containing protein [Eubacterium sp.]|nr:ATP-binding cassette domain-containing protein [Eubacterium sp.]